MSGPTKRPAPDPAEPTSEPERSAPDQFVVGIGASAGGFEAINEVLKGIADISQLAVIVVQHLDPKHESHLVDLLRRATNAPVHWAEHGRAIEAGHVYVSPPHTAVTVRERKLLLAPSGETSGGEINFFFRSLAEDVKDCAVGVVLSGSGSDGVSGVRAIKGAGGVVFAQDPSTANFPAMPRAAIDSRCVDRVLSPTGIARELGKLHQDWHAIKNRIETNRDGAMPDRDAEHLARIFWLLALRTGIDFSDYKQSTIKRRLARRMMLAQVSHLPDYIKLLQQNRDEAQQLYESLLINVTEFFRDSDYFDYISAQVLPDIIEQHADNSPIRVWAPGCATGEEVYSLGIMLREALEQRSASIPVQIFGTDISEAAIDIARAGLYRPSDVAMMRPERLKQHFDQTERGYVIKKQIRDTCIFARHNVVKDSPFSRLDLISCRNLLIYLGPQLQRKLMPIFYYALQPGRYLILGSSESVGGHADLFRVVDRQFRIYARKSSAHRAQLEFSSDAGRHSATPRAKLPSTPTAEDMKDPFDVIREADRIVLSRHAPTGVLVTDGLEILQFRGDVSPYLAPVSGRATLNVLKMAHEGLATELRMALQTAREQNIPVRRAGVVVMRDSTAQIVDFEVTPIAGPRTGERFYLVLFTAGQPGRPALAGDAAAAAGPTQIPENALIEQLRYELHATRTFLQSTIEKHETTNQELSAANEEIQSSNEELQSTNEELETAKEELQSTNEELTTVNEELHNRQSELILLNNDLHNLINSVHLPIVILAHDMRIRRFTPMAEKTFNIISSDIGRPLSDINIGLDVQNISRLITQVTDTLSSLETEVQDRQGHWYSLRLRPYRTAENKIEGSVLTLIDIDQIKRSLGEAEEARSLAQAIIETTREPLAVLTAELQIESASQSFYDFFRTTKERAEGKSFFDAFNEPEKLFELRRALEGILPKHTSLTNHKVSVDLPGTGPTTVTIDVRQIRSSARMFPLFLLSVRPT